MRTKGAEEEERGREEQVVETTTRRRRRPGTVLTTGCRNCRRRTARTPEVNAGVACGVGGFPGETRLIWRCAKEGKGREGRDEKNEEAKRDG